MTLQYTITPSQPRAHLYTVSCTVPAPNPDGQCFVLPAWTPGSYLIRDFARHVTRFSAVSGGQSIQVHKLDKHSWRCEPCPGPLTVTYDVYARDDSVRAAWLDTTRGFFNGSVVFMRAEDQAELPIQLHIQPPLDLAEHGWRVATTLASAGAAPWGFGLYAAGSYDELIDHPVEMGNFDLVEYQSCGVPHHMALTGRHRTDTARLQSDLSRLCAEQLSLFGAPAPIERYLFLTRVVRKGYGGLEHRDSSALICARDDLPLAGEARVTRGYRSFLGLCSHEYFHLWNVKRIRPQAFAESSLTEEAYTEDLWAYEGVTSYYDELCLMRAGLIDLAAYCELLAEAATRLWRTPGRSQQSLASASFDAWIKFYRPDENTPNALVSYYNKGALVALCLDLRLRLETQGRCDLDQVMRALWHEYGQTDRPVPERTLETLAQSLSGVDLRDFFERLVRGTEDPPLADLLPCFGLEARLCMAPTTGERAHVATGLRMASASAQVQHVLTGSPAQIAGMAAGDTLVALDGLRVEAQDLDRVLATYAPGDKLRVHAFRRDELMEFELELAPRAADTWLLRPMAEADSDALARRKAWLRQA